MRQRGQAPRCLIFYYSYFLLHNFEKICVTLACIFTQCLSDEAWGNISIAADDGSDGGMSRAKSH